MIKVSVIVHTYKHENYIRQTLDSIVNQQVNFEYEVIVGDDASPIALLILLENISKNILT
jgi:glycosyltransferase involved in cell wall biosynthesis